MKDSPLTLSDIRREVIAAGAYSCGVVEAQPVSSDAAARYESWLAGGNAGEMDYLDRYAEVRRDPRLLLDGEGAKTLIVTLFAYEDHVDTPPGVPYIARYALGTDYHEVLRRRLKGAIAALRQRAGGKWRVCVDSAPLMERYWAARAGLGVIGDNGYLIVPGVGANFFIATIVTTAALPTDIPVEGPPRCRGCGSCVRACPTGALHADGTVDARRCLSYLTIEHHGDIPADIPAGNTLYGCDACRKACPMARPAKAPQEGYEAFQGQTAPTPPAVLPEFSPDPRLVSMTAADWLALDEAGYAALTAHSPMRRAILAKLHSTLRHLRKPMPGG